MPALRSGRPGRDGLVPLVWPAVVPPGARPAFETTRGLADPGARCARGRPSGRRTRGVALVGGTRADQGRRAGLAHRRARGVDGPRDADRLASDGARGSEGDAGGGETYASAPKA